MTKPIIAASSRIVRKIEMFPDFLKSLDFKAVEWSFDEANYPPDENYMGAFTESLKMAPDLPIRYHAPFTTFEIGHSNKEFAKKSLELLQNPVDLVSHLGGEYLTVHFGLGYGERQLSIEIASENLQLLAAYALKKNVAICLENLDRGPTSDLDFLKEIVEQINISAVLDIGHARSFYGMERAEGKMVDFLQSMKGRIGGAHIYQIQKSSKHYPFTAIEGNEDILQSLFESGCRWWVVEMPDLGGSISTKKILQEFLKSAFPI